MSTRIYVGVAVLVVVAVIAAAIALTRPDSVQPMPSKDDPAAYTVASVEDAIQRYERDGREATAAYYNNAASVDGQWYVFIVDDGGITIAHHNSKFRGRDPSERVDVTGYFYGDELLGATEEGRWISYVIENPETGGNAQKHTWVMRRDGLLFASGWYE